MSLPLMTSTATIERPAGDSDPYEMASVDTIASQVPAHVSAPKGDAAKVGGAKETIDVVIYLPAGQDVDRYDRITIDGETTYSAQWVIGRAGLGLAYTSVGAQRVEGAAAA